MAIEEWDEARKRWILYRRESAHSLDCENYPYEALPGRIFLDTNVVNLLLDYTEQIFEQQLLPEFPNATLAEDVEALMHIFNVGRLASWSVMASSKTLGEIDNTPDALRREQLREYAVDLISPEDGVNAYSSVVGRRLIDAPFTAVLPDLADRELIGNAIGLECDVFCTRDRRTIIKKRDQLRLLPIKILTPLEWWRHIRPWAGLFT